MEGLLQYANRMQHSLEDVREMITNPDRNETATRRKVRKQLDEAEALTAPPPKATAAAAAQEEAAREEAAAAIMSYSFQLRGRARQLEAAAAATEQVTA